MKVFEEWQKEYCAGNCIHIPALKVCEICNVPIKQREGWRAALEWVRNHPNQSDFDSTYYMMDTIDEELEDK